MNQLVADEGIVKWGCLTDGYLARSLHGAVKSQLFRDDDHREDKPNF